MEIQYEKTKRTDKNFRNCGITTAMYRKMMKKQGGDGICNLGYGKNMPIPLKYLSRTLVTSKIVNFK